MKQLNENKMSVRIPTELTELIKYYSKRLRVTQSEFVRDAVIEQINKARLT